VTVRILLVDDHAVVRDGLRAALRAALPAHDVSEASTAREGIAKIQQEPFDAVVLDLSLPDMNGIEALKAMRLARPRLPVVVFSMHTDREYCLRCLRAGAMAYVTKDGAADDITQAVAAVLAGRRFVSRQLAEHLVGALIDAGDRPRHEALSDREFQVLCMLGAGKTVSEVAAQLCLSVKTISTYRARLLEKLELANNAQIMRYALDHNLLH
jgi:DNA-binding NarL/FixJ family response regulator